MIFYTHFKWEHSLDGEFRYTSNDYPVAMILVDPSPWKMINAWKKHDVDVNITFFHVFLIFHREGSTKSMYNGYSLDVDLNSPSKSAPTWNFSKAKWRLVENTSWKSRFLLLLHFTFLLNLFTFLLKKRWFIPYGWHHQLESF